MKESITVDVFLQNLQRKQCSVAQIRNIVEKVRCEIWEQRGAMPSNNPGAQPPVTKSKIVLEIKLKLTPLHHMNQEKI